MALNLFVDLQRRQLADEVAAAARRQFTVYRTDTLRSVKPFNYLGRIIAHDDCNTPAIQRNLKRACQVWRRIFKIIAKEEVAAKVAGIFYQVAVATVLLYGSET